MSSFSMPAGAASTDDLQHNGTRIGSIATTKKAAAKYAQRSDVQCASTSAKLARRPLVMST
jgi:hypothetical protein